MLDTLLSLDGAVLLWIQEFVRCGILDPLIAFYTQLGNAGILWIVLSVVMLFFRKTRRAGVLSLLAMLLGLLFTNVAIKHLVARPRPWLTVEGLSFLVVENDPNSFPSGPNRRALGGAGGWVRTLARKWVGGAAVALAALMGISRLYVGVHFPSDVAAGCLVGLLCAWMAWRLYQAAENRWGPIRWLDT